MKKAWIITWDDWREKGEKYNKIVDILDSRVGDNKIKELVEKYYVNSMLTLSERLNYAKSKKTSYSAKIDRISCINGRGIITCGHTPFLEARRVINLEIKVNLNGEEYLKYDENQLNK